MYELESLLNMQSQTGILLSSILPLFQPENEVPCQPNPVVQERLFPAVQTPRRSGRGPPACERGVAVLYCNLDVCSHSQYLVLICLNCLGHGCLDWWSKSELTPLMPNSRNCLQGANFSQVGTVYANTTYKTYACARRPEP